MGGNAPFREGLGKDFGNRGIAMNHEDLLGLRGEVFDPTQKVVPVGVGGQTLKVDDPGPDSNFSIWSAGGYIFGYDEIDTTMEVEETEESREQTVTWEMRQLGIMDWITNDVDWMTGEVHADVKRLAWHN